MCRFCKKIGQKKEKELFSSFKYLYNIRIRLLIGISVRKSTNEIKRKTVKLMFYLSWDKTLFVHT